MPVVWVALFLLSGCSHQDGILPSPAAAKRGALLQSPVHIVAAFSPALVRTLLQASPLGQTLLQLVYTPLCTITVYHLEYQTVDPAGQLTPASGALMVPSGGTACEGGRPVVVYAHATRTDRNFNIADLTASGNDEGLLMAAVFASEGYIVVAPNYVGYDISSLGYHPYLNADQQSKDMIDAVAAARSALPTFEAPSSTDGGKLFVAGYSQGGYVAMATHRAMQAAGMTVTAAAPMSGPYALAAFGDAVFEGRVNMGAPVSMTLLVSGYQHAYGNIYTATTDVFSAAYATGIDSLLPSTTAIGTLESSGKIPSALFNSSPPDPAYAAYTPATTPSNLAGVFAAGFGTNFLISNPYRADYLKDALVNPDGGFPAATDGLPPAKPANTLRQAFKANDLRAGAPTAPVLLCGGDADPTVLYLNTQLIKSYWAATAPSAPVTVIDVDSTPAANDPYQALKAEFVVAKAAIIASAIAGGATDGGLSALLNVYHAGLVSPFCLSAAKSFFDAQ
jgi:pimeloyl-ACP methyl ester carboxylesterase